MFGIDRKKWKEWLSLRYQRAVRTLPKLLPLTFIGVILILAYFGIADIRALAETSTANAPLTAADLKDRIDELKWTLGLILAASGLFTIAQSIVAGFSAQSFTKQAEDGLARMQKMEREAKTSFPLFAETEVRRTLALESLKRILPDEGFNWQRHFYERLPIAQRQELLAVERFLSYEIAGQNADNVEYARTLRKLAQFYFTKFIYEKGRGFGYIDDIERAEYLLGLARRRIGPAFYLSNDLGNVHLEAFKARMDYLSSKGTSQSSVKSETISSFQQAVRDFEDSIESQPRQLRAYYNLAVIEADHRHNEQEAITWLEKGLKFPNWEHEPVPALTCVAWFNLACYNARLFATQGEDAQARVKGCMEALEKAAAIGQLSPVDVEHEYSFKMEFLRQGSSHQLIPQDQQGDLSPLTQSGDEQTKLHLAELKTKLSTHFKENSPDTEEYY